MPLWFHARALLNNAQEMNLLARVSRVQAALPFLAQSFLLLTNTIDLVAVDH